MPVNLGDFPVLSTFNPSGYAQFAALGTSTKIQLPTGSSPSDKVLVTNIGPEPAIVVLGDSTVTAVLSPVNGVALMPGDSVSLATGANTYIAAICINSQSKAVLNVAVGV